MTSREFWDGIVAKLATIPFIGRFFKEKVVLPTTIFDTAELNQLVQEAFNKDVSSKNLLFYERAKILQKDDIEIIGKFKGTTYIADVLVKEGEEVNTYESGYYAFSNNEIPYIKIGSRVSEMMIKREGLIQECIKDKKPLDEYSTRFIADWKRTFAESMAVGLKQRINSMLIAAALGGQSNANGHVVNWDFGVPEGIHAKTDWSITEPVASIQGHLRYMDEEHRKIFDRITMSSHLFRSLAPSLVEVHAPDEFKALFLRKDSEGNFTISDMKLARQLLANVLQMEVEIYDGYYYVRMKDGKRVQQRYLPEDRILFSHTDNDKNVNALYFASSITAESIVSRSFGNPITDDGPSYGPIGYFRCRQDLNPPDVTGWAVMRGMPVLVDPGAFASLQVKVKEEVTE
jgi:hypothetical protein